MHRKELILILTAIFIFTALICYLSILVTYLPQSKYKQGLLFAVKLPAHAVESKEIERIRRRFNKQMTHAGIVMAVLLIVPLILLHRWSAYQVIYFFVWMTVFLMAMVIPFRRAFRDTLALKRANDWYVGSKRVILGDLRVAQWKNKRSAPMAVFMTPAAMSVGLMWWAQERGLFGAGIAAPAVTALLAAVSLAVRRTKSKVYSRNSEVNVCLNQFSRRMWSYALWLLAVVENVHLWIVCMLLLNDNEKMFGVWLAMASVFAAIPLGIVWCAHRKIKTLEQEVLASDGQTVFTDDDEYWGNGFTYHNPNDRSLFVEKRVGIGMTINTGTLAGKIIMGSAAALTAGIMIAVSFMLVRSELTAPSMTVTQDRRVEIHYPMYGYHFAIADIEQLALVDEIPPGTKMNGEATERYARGHFRLRELGKSRLYIFKNNPPYIQIKLSDGYIYYNDEDPLETERLFEQLRHQFNSRQAGKR